MADYYFITVSVAGSQADISAMSERLNAEKLYASVEEFDSEHVEANADSFTITFDSKSLVKTVEGLTGTSAAYPNAEIELDYRNPNYQEAGVITIRAGAIIDNRGLGIADKQEDASGLTVETSNPVCTKEPQHRPPERDRHRGFGDVTDA